MTAFSQADIGISITDSLVPLPKNVAKEVVRELIRKDSIQAELTTCFDNQSLLEHNLSIKDSIILSQDTQLKLKDAKEQNYETTIQLKDAQITNLNNLVDKLNTDLKKNRRKLIWKSVRSTTAITGLALLLFYIAK